MNCGLSQTSFFWDCFERSWGFPNDCAVIRRLRSWGWSKKSMINELVNRILDKQSESVTVCKPTAHTVKVIIVHFHSVKGRRPALYFTVSLSEGPQARTFYSVIPQRPALHFTVSLSDSSKPTPYCTAPLSEMQLVRTVTQWAAPKPATSITV